MIVIRGVERKGKRISHKSTAFILCLYSSGLKNSPLAFLQIAIDGEKILWFLLGYLGFDLGEFEPN